MSTTDSRETSRERREFVRDVVVKNPLGIHARPAALLVKTASGFKSEVTLEKDGQMVSAKSIMGVLTLAGHYGSKMRIRARGPDAEQAVDAVAELFEKHFYE